MQNPRQVVVPLCLVAAAFLVIAVGTGCSSATKPSAAPSDCTSRPGADCVVIASSVPPGSACAAAFARLMDERELRARVQDGVARVTVPLHGSSACPHTGQVALDLVDVVASPERVVSVNARWFSVAAGEKALELPLSGVEGAGAALARYVISYRVSVPAGEVRGRRSLMDAVDKLQVVMLAPETLPAGARTHLRVIARDPRTGAPLAGALVVASAEPAEGAPTELWRGSTGESGEALVTFVAPESSGEAQLAVRVSHPRGEETVRTPLRLVRDRRILLTTDKPQYQPGQTMHLRTLTLRRPSLAPEAGKDLVLEIRDARGNKVARRKLLTDRFGIAATKFEIASEVNKGEWSVRAIMGETSVEKKLKVDRYALPRFAVTIRPDKPYYLPGDKIRGEISARYFFGKPVAGGKVDLRASASGEGLPGEFAHVQTTTNESGLCTFELSLPSLSPAALEKGAAVSLTATATDAADHPETKAVSVPLAAGPLVVTVLPEGGAAVPGLENRFIVAVADPAGRAAAGASIAASGPAFSATATADAQGVASLVWTPPAEGGTVEITATAPGGASHLRRYSVAPAPNGALVIRTDKAVYRVGETARIEVLAPAGVARVFVDVLRDGESAAALSLEPKDGRVSYPLEITREFAGALQLDASYPGTRGIVRAARPVYVDPGNDLHVAVALAGADGAARTQFRPGEEARVRFTVTGEGGQPQAAALGVAAVDEAVFALTEQRTGLERVYFNLGSDKLRADGVAGFTAADVVGSSDPARREQAAQILLAASGSVPGLGTEVDSYRTIQKSATVLLQPRVQADLDSVRPAVQEAWRSGRVNWQNYEAELPRILGEKIDPFGRAYAALVADWKATLTSGGPDETDGTGDDLTLTVELWRLLDWWWGDADAMAGAGGPAGGPPMAPEAAEKNDDAGGAPRVRSYFPETLFVQPAVLTDASGRAEIAIPLADSITTWRMSALASTTGGLLGSTDAPLPVFQEFFADVDLPVSLTRGDEVSVPVAVHNYLTQPQNVTLEVQPAAWFSLTDAATKSVTLAAGEVGAVRFRLRAERPGRQELTVVARGSGVSDAVRRGVDVAPDGREVTASASGRLAGPVETTFDIPPEAQEGATSLVVKIYPGVLSQAVEGLDSMLHMPGGCMEQTTSTAWPNVMVMSYLRRSGRSNPQIEEKAGRYLNAGYQRVLTFEKHPGGFGWWPNESEQPNRTLTAIGLMELYDTGRVTEVDPEVLTRSQTFLAASQQADGSWPAGDALHAGNETLAEKPERATAFIAWALVRAGDDTGAGARALAFLRARIDTLGAYELALAANAFLSRSPVDPDGMAILERLEAMKTADEQGTRWVPQTGTFTGARGDVGTVEVTGLVASAMMRGSAHPESVEGALRWLAAKKDAMGNWYATQATVNALRAFVDSLQPQGGGTAAHIAVSLNGVPAAAFDVTPDDSDVMRQADLSSLAVPGANRLSIEYTGTGALLYQAVARHHLPRDGAGSAAPLSLDVSWNRTALRTGEMATATAAVTNGGAAPMDQVIVQLGVPPGFSPSQEDLDALVQRGAAARHETASRQVTFYLMGLAPGERRVLPVRMQAGTAGSVRTPQSSAWLYYAPDVRRAVDPVAIEVTE